MPPTTSHNGAKSRAQQDDLGGLIEREQLPSGRADLVEPLVAHSQRERILNAMAEACAAKGFGATTIADIGRGGRRLPRHLLRAVQGQGGLPAGQHGALAGRRDGPHRRGLLARQTVGDDGPRRRRHLPRPARHPPRLRPHGADRGAGGRRPLAGDVRLRQAGAAGAARPRPQRPDRGTGDPLQRRPRRPRRRRVADRRPDPRRQHRAAAGTAAGHRLHRHHPLPRPGRGAAAIPGSGEVSPLPGRAERCPRPRQGERWRPPRGRHGLPPEVVARSQRDRLLEATMADRRREGLRARPRSPT